MNDISKTGMDWTRLILSPSGKNEGSLAQPLLEKLIEGGHIQSSDLLAAGPGIPFDDLPYVWLSEDDRSYNKKKNTHPCPVWAHWLFNQVERDGKKASLFLVNNLPAEIWIHPIYDELCGLDWLAQAGQHEILDRVLSQQDPDLLKAKQDTQSRMGTASLNSHTTPEVARVLVRHGWNVAQPDARGKTAIETTGIAPLFLALLDLGADPDLARKNVSKVAGRANERQILIQAINKKAAERKGAASSGQQRSHDDVAKILESGVSGGFGAKLSKLAKEYPKGSTHGLMVGGRSAGGAMLRLAGRLSVGGRQSPKAKSYMALCEAFLSENGKGWVNLDQPIVGAPGLNEFTDRDGMLMGAVVMLASAQDTWKPGITSKVDVPPQVAQALRDWIPGMSPLLAKWEQHEPDAVDLTELLGTLSKPGTATLDKVVSRWWEGVGSDDPVMKALFAQDWSEQDKANISADLLVDLRKTWPEWLTDKVKSLQERQELSGEWRRAAGDQWRNLATRFLFGEYRNRNEEAISKSLRWTLEDDSLIPELSQWDRWCNKIFETPRPLEDIPHRFRTDEEDEAVKMGQQATRPLGDVVHASRWGENEGEEAEEAALLRRLPLQLKVLERRPGEPGASGHKPKL